MDGESTAVRSSTRARRLDDGLRAVPALVLGFLVLDVVSTIGLQVAGVTGLGRFDVLSVTQYLLVLVAVWAVLWHRPRLAAVCAVPIAAQAVALGGSGFEEWLTVTVAVTAAVRARAATLAAVATALAVYALLFGWGFERRNPGEGLSAGLITLALPAVGVLAGLVARRLLRARDRARRRVEVLERETVEIRAAERLRLADELQVVVTHGLDGVGRELDAAPRTADAAGLQRTLGRVDAGNRAVLVELRALLEVLRGAGDPTGRPSPDAADPAVPVVARSGVRPFQLALTGIAAVLAARAVLSLLVGGSEVAAGPLVVQLLGLIALAVAPWWPRRAAVVAGLALVVATVERHSGYADLLPLALLTVLAVVLPPRRTTLWLLPAGLVGYAALVAATDTTDRSLHLTVLGYVVLLALAAGVVLRHLRGAWAEARSQTDRLLDQQSRAGTDERDSVARELHDIVAHQLSVSTMLVMAATGSDDPIALAGTLDRLRAGHESARHDLDLLLHALRGERADEVRAAPLVTPRVAAAALERRLREGGLQPSVTLDPDADRLDPTTQRTLARILQEGTTNILRHSPPGAACAFELTVTPDRVRLRVTSALGAERGPHALSLGWGLRGIRERVDLTDGTFAAGPVDGRWVLEVELPAGLAPGSPAAAGLHSPGTR